MGKIIVLDEETINRIAAGEVIERPSSVVKELVENSIDAGADKIDIEIKKGGISSIKVIDNGEGIAEDDLEIAFERHATSKIRYASNLDSIKTMGFRGEALSSIAAVSKVSLISRQKNSDYGMKITVRGGIYENIIKAGCPLGTSIVVKDLFFNTPARYKFLKADSTEAASISDIVTRLALGNQGISFTLSSENRKDIIHTPGSKNLIETIYSIYGSETAHSCAEINYTNNMIKITGYAGTPDISRSNRNNQSLYINRRYIKSRLLVSAVEQAYETILMKNRYPFVILNIELSPEWIDVNVHPSKLEVKFSKDREIFESVINAVKKALQSKPALVGINKYYSQKSVNQKPNTDNYNSSIINEKQISSIYGYKDNPLLNLNKDTFYNKDFSKIIGGEIKKHQGIDETDIQDTKITDQNSVEIRNPDIKNLEIIGQAFSSYILAQQNDILYMVDQHAAHEKIIFEELEKEYKKGYVISQNNIIPIVMELSPSEMETAEQNKDIIQKYGFIFELYGNNSIVIRSIPVDISESSEALFAKLLEILTNTDSNDGSNMNNEAIYSIACKRAIKANKKLDKEEIKHMFRRLSELDNPYTCPHGRPVFVNISKYELEKMFKRRL